MKVSTDTRVDGAVPAGPALPAEPLIEVQAADGTCWAHVVIPGGKTVMAAILRAEGAAPEPIDVRLNPSWSGPVAAAPDTAGLSTRGGWPRLVLTLVALPADEAA